jgi:Metallo-peptidase family M12B Reprolysin-like
MKPIRKIYLMLNFLTLMGVNLAQAETVEVLVVYPDYVSNIYGASLPTLIQGHLNWANQAYANSSVNISLTLVGSAQMNHPLDDACSLSLLEELVRYQPLNALQDQYKPDLTVFLVAPNSQTDCGGWGYLPDFTFHRTGFVPTPAAPFKGLSIAQYNSPSVVAHEIGHNLGAGHGWQYNDSGVAFINDGFPVLTARGYGVENVFRTIMSYADIYGAAPELQYFSNPAVTVCCSFNLACGTSSFNSISGFNQSKTYVSNYSSCYPSIYGQRYGLITRRCRP